MNWTHFLAVLVARNKEFMRDRAALAWNFIFPVLIVVGFAVTFSGKSLDQYKVGIAHAAEATKIDFLATEYIQFIPVDDLDKSITKVERHQLDMLLDGQQQRFWINETSPSGYILERVLRGTGGEAYAKQMVTGEEVRYVDWLIPGVLGMNMMFSALFGVGYVMVRYRKNGVLKRLKATPLTALEFLSAQIVSRMWLIVMVTTIVYFGTHIFINFRMLGSYFDLLIVLLLGSFALISLGLVVAARLKSEELAGGLLNMASWPMMFLSGVWFSLEGLQPWVQNLALIFPLTHIIDAARAIMIDGAGLTAISSQLLILAVMSIIFLLMGALSFRWE